MTEPTQNAPAIPESNPNFRVTQALYKTILVNIKVILALFVIALAGWLFWYLTPLTKANSTYTASSHETALKTVVEHLIDTRKGADMAINFADVTENNASSDTAKSTASCGFLTEASQKRYQANIDTINASLTNFYQQKTLANQYQLDTQGLWQSACQQNISDDDMSFALKTLANKDKIQQLNWAERRPNYRVTNGKNSATNTGVASLPDNWLTQTNPWYGLPGCVYLKTPVTKDNPTGYSYVDSGDRTEMAQLCNNPKLIPVPVKATAIANSTAMTKPNNTLANTVNNLKNQAENELNIATNSAQTIKSTNDNDINLPANLGLMYSELSNIHASHFDKQLLEAYENYQQKNDQRSWWQKLTAPPINSIKMDGANVKIGYNMELTLDPTVQNTAQLIAECLTNNPNNSNSSAELAQKCQPFMSAGVQGVANQMYENALVRSIGIAVLDVKNDNILALASSESPCYAKDNGGSDDLQGCPLLWKKDWSGQNLLNHAVYQTVSPGSIVKSVQALGLVRANPAFKDPNTADFAYLKQVMASSSTERVANYLFCYQTTSNFILRRDSQGVCPGITAYKKASNDMGWSANCDKASPICGFKDMLFGLPYNPEPMLQSRYFSGVLLTDTKQNLTNLNFDNDQVASCVQANDGRMTGSCSRGGNQLNEVMNEVFGAGNAKTSVLGAADMFSTLLIADNGQKVRRGAHIVQDMWGVNQIRLRPKAWRGDAPYGQYDNLATMPVNISQSDAQSALRLISGTLLAGTGLGGGNGTAYTACTQAIGDCGWTNGVIVGKTGTPGFNFPTGNGDYTPDVTTKMVEANCYNPEKPSFLCQNRPYKWFIMGIKNKQGQWDKAVTVMVERNWTKSGLIDDPHDGINRAVQAGMILAKQMYK